MERTHRSLKTTTPQKPTAIPPSIPVTVEAENEDHWVLRNTPLGLQFNWPKAVQNPAIQLGTDWTLALVAPNVKPTETEHLDSLRQLLQELIQ